MHRCHGAGETAAGIPSPEPRETQQQERAKGTEVSAPWGGGGRGGGGKESCAKSQELQLWGRGRAQN